MSYTVPCHKLCQHSAVSYKERPWWVQHRAEFTILRVAAAELGSPGRAVLYKLMHCLSVHLYLAMHMQVFLWYGTLYMLFMWIYGSVSGNWRYGLDWTRSRAVGAYILIPLIGFIMFIIWYAQLK